MKKLKWTKARRAKFSETISARRRNNKQPEFILYQDALYRRVPGITRVK